MSSYLYNKCCSELIRAVREELDEYNSIDEIINAFEIIERGGKRFCVKKAEDLKTLSSKIYDDGCFYGNCSFSFCPLSNYSNDEDKSIYNFLLEYKDCFGVEIFDIYRLCCFLGEFMLLENAIFDYFYEKYCENEIYSRLKVIYLMDALK